jgi:hypothetical protein
MDLARMIRHPVAVARLRSLWPTAAPLAAALVVALSAACELVAGSLPEPKPDGEGGAAATATSCAKPPCDCDGDGHEAKGTCGGDDCDDLDARVFPHQSEYFTAPDRQGDFDYDCSGSAEVDPASNAHVDCSVPVLQCDTKSAGYVGPIPSCGQGADWGTCQSDTLHCSPEVTAHDRRMGCH